MDRPYPCTNCPVTRVPMNPCNRDQPGCRDYAWWLREDHARLRAALAAERKAREEDQRWEIGFRNIVTRTIGPRAPFEIHQVVNLVGAAWAERDRLLERVKVLEDVLVKIFIRDHEEPLDLITDGQADGDFISAQVMGPLAQLAAEALLPLVAPCGGANGGGEDCFAGCEYRLRCPNVGPKIKEEFAALEAKQGGAS